MAKTVLNKISEVIRDGENNAVMYDYAYNAKGDQLHHTLAQIKIDHGKNTRLLPLSGVSAGGGVFQVEHKKGGDIVGIRIPPATTPRLSESHDIDLSKIALDEIIIDSNSRKIVAGAAITLQQLNTALADTLGSCYKVLGADLTSYTYAQVGATFMTGGMGPQRRYFSDSVDQIVLHDGENTKIIEGVNLNGYAGTFGWTGMISAVRCQFHKLPGNEIAFAIPVINSAGAIAKLLTHLSPYCFLDTSQFSISTKTGHSDLILGLEHVTVSSMQPLFATAKKNEVIKRARHLAEKCHAANADGLIFVNGFSNRHIDEFLMQLLDDAESGTPTIAGINLEHTEVFNDADLMRSLREAIPFAARTQKPAGQYTFKNHTDVNIRLDSNNVLNAVEKFWDINMNYVQSIETYFSKTPHLTGEIIIYGHLNPFGLDPHNRITLASDDKTTFDQAMAFITRQQSGYFRQLKNLCDLTGAIYVGGEKSAGSEARMFSAFGTLDNAPQALRQKFTLQRQTIAASSCLFRWRALTPYV